MNLRTIALLYAVAGSWAAVADAAIVTHSGQTSTAPTYNRLLEDLSGLSGVGTAVHYDAYGFTVGTAGSYTFLTTGQFDTFSFLYSPTFSAPVPLSNAKIGNDDLLSLTTSGFEYALTPGVSYTLITTGFANADFGAFSSTIGGPGSITPTAPEPAPVPVSNLVTFAGSTAGDPTFNRLLEDLSGLSGVGTGVHYDTYRFRVATSGQYTFLSTGNFDTFAFLYSPVLDPAHPLINAKTANDDLLSLTTSGFAYDLLAGIDYTYVLTGFANTDFGAFSTTIGGPGAIIATAVGPVPEPETWGLLVAGLTAVGAFARRRRSFA